MKLHERYPEAKFVNQSKRDMDWDGDPKGICTIGEDVALNDAVIDFTGGVTIEDRVHFGREVMILSCSHPTGLTNGLQRRRGLICREVTIERDAYLGSRVLVLPGVRIGMCSYVAGGSVVLEDIPPFQLWGGYPAKFIRLVE